MRPAATAVVVLSLLAGCSSEPEGPTGPDLSQPVSVTYEVTGTAGSVDVVIVSGDERTEATGRSLPLRTEAGGPVTVEVPIHEQVRIEATVGATGGQIVCRILVDGEEVTSSNAFGAGATATCDSYTPMPATSAP